MSFQIPIAVGEGANLAVSEAVFGQNYNEPLIHQVLVAYLASARAGTKAQKSRSEVSGGGAKPWRQKGTGRARAGTMRSPLWRTGGVTFASDPRNYRKKVNRKMYRGALRSIFSELLRQGRLFVHDDLYPSEPKCRLLLAKLGQTIDGRILLVTDKLERNLELSVRNLANVSICQSSNIDLLGLINTDRVLVTTEAARQLEAALT